MTRYTEKTIRANGQWVKITRDNKERKFTFAKGTENEVTAYTIETLTFKWVANWTEAIERATNSTKF
jgi:hypothetical protein